MLNMDRPILYLVSIDDALQDDVYDRMIELVDEARAEQIKKFHFRIDSIRGIVGYLLSKYMITTYSELSWNQIEFAKTEYGKPYIKTDSANLIEYNISHSGNYVAGAIYNKPVGIDIEQRKKAMMDIAKRCFDSNEVAYIKADLEKADEHFYEIWTRKESYVKTIGKGLALPFSSFNSLEPTLIYEGISYRIQNISVNEDYSAAFCCEVPVNEILLKKLTMYELIEKIESGN